MEPTLWSERMESLQRCQAYLESCNVIDIAFTNGMQWEVYVAATKNQRQQGLSDVSQLDLAGMLFCYDTPALVPFHMRNMEMDLDIAWYDEAGRLLQHKHVSSLYKGPVFCPLPFSYVLEAPLGTIPPTDLAVTSG